MTTKQLLISLSASLCLSFSVTNYADGNRLADGQHNDKTCYAETAGGIKIDSPCSSRGTTCNDDFTCSINGVDGTVGNGLKKEKMEADELASPDTEAKPEIKKDRVKRSNPKL